MDNFNDFYNRFIISNYGVNILSYLFFITVFFIIILFAIVTILWKNTKNDSKDGYEFQSTTYKGQDQYFV